MNISKQTCTRLINTNYRIFLITSIVYWILVMGMWGIFALSRGLTFETSFPLNCNKSLYDCLIYLDKLRPYNSLFLGTAHLLGSGNGGYVSYQLLYGFLWWGRGILIFLIFYRIFPTFPLLGFLVGALTIVHASDNALNWIGQLHQFGFLFFLVLAVYLFLESWYARKNTISFSLLIGTLISLHISLWTYESHYFIVLTIPFLLLLLAANLSRRLLFFGFIWYILPFTYGVLQLQRYIIAKTSTYQASIIRPDLDVVPILTDLQINLFRSVEFWTWGLGVSNGSMEQIAIVVSLLCTTSFIIGSYLLAENGFRCLVIPSRKTLLVVFGIGFLLLVLSFPIYLLLVGSTQFWRTQILSGFGAAILLGSGVLLGSYGISIKSQKCATFIASISCAIIVFFGVRAGVALQDFHAHPWQIQRQLMAQVYQLAPKIRNHTLFLLIDLPKDAGKDPFGASMWFDLPIQLLYPEKQVSGHFFYQDGSQPTDDCWAFTPDGIRRVKPGFAKQVEFANYSQIIALKYGKGGRLSILPQLPAKLAPDSSNVSSYAPYQRIEKGFMSEKSIRMFGQ